MRKKRAYKNARAFIVLLAALIALLLNIKFKRQLVQSLTIVIVVIIIFYILSSIALRLIDKISNMDNYKVLDLAADNKKNDNNISDDVNNEQYT